MKLDGNQLLKQFKDHGITNDATNKNFQHTLYFQDFIGHMNNAELQDFYKELDQNERKNFIWACSVCLSPDSLIDILKSTTIHLERVSLYDDFEQEFADRDQKAWNRERTFEDCKKPIHKKIASLKGEIETLKNRLAWQVTCNQTLKESNTMLYKRNAQVERKACDFDNLKAAFSLITD